MIYNVYRTTANSVKGWFPFGLPIPARVVTVLEMSAYREMDAQVEQHLVSLNNRARGLNLSTGTSDELHAASLLFNVYRYLLGVWSGEGISADTRLNELRERVGEADFSDAKYRFCRVYPPAPDKETPTRFVVETILLRMCKSNPALALFRNLLIEPLPADASDAPATFAGPSVSNFESVIEEDVYYQRIMEVVSEAPDDLKAQLRHTVSRWGHALPAAFVDPILRAIDVLNEVHTFRGAPGEFVHSEPLVYDYQRSGLTEITAERFTPDRDWMSNVVLIAKQTYVWLFQLSEQYGREIRRLDDIPDEELDRLAGLGFTGLWLIGLWRRSQASETIKRRMGNPEAIASAYALDDYEIAQELGGVPAYEVLAEKANKRGIRLAADMVPNHVGIDGQWVKHHPERFISTHQLPYENYRFEGPDLCEDPHLSIYLEDGYYSQTDAAVVFKRVDHSSGDVRYIYHGNDGTQMPWNDTAQLDYLNADVREQVIQMILSVARRFPIIRFDAAMTLAKRHIQRLWYPQPGGGGAIPSRSKFGGCSSEDFERAIPKEFWREVVDRINDELPDTLLLAEAFWMMEGYFVRNLGMHRVYNSAFMNMLKREHNSDYRTTIKNTLAFSPEILKRFVNFMNNPDEETAVAQFGRGDKYLGNAILMATMPGLPMFGHGQVEGYEEKYGMEYQRPQLSEHVDEHLVWMHKRYIAPLLHDRHLFAETTFFHLYDFELHPGATNENVFAYSNRCGDERVLVLYNNSYDSTRGQIALSVEWNSGSSEAPILQRCSLLDGLGYANDADGYYRCVNVMSGKEYLFRASDLNLGGMWFELAGYQTMVLRGFAKVEGSVEELEAIRHSMAPAGIDSIDRSRCHYQLGALYDEWQTLVSSIDNGQSSESALRALANDPRASHLFTDAKHVEPTENVMDTPNSTTTSAQDHLGKSAPALIEIDAETSVGGQEESKGIEQSREADTPDTIVRKLTRLGLLYATLSDQGKMMIGDSILSCVDSSERPLVKVITELVEIKPLSISGLFESQAVRDVLGVHRHNNVSWFRKENVEQFLSVLYYIDGLGRYRQLELPEENDLRLLIEQSGYRYQDLIFLLKRIERRVDLGTKPNT